MHGLASKNRIILVKHQLSRECCNTANVGYCNEIIRPSFFYWMRKRTSIISKNSTRTYPCYDSFFPRLMPSLTPMDVAPMESYSCTLSRIQPLSCYCIHCELFKWSPAPKVTYYLLRNFRNLFLGFSHLYNCSFKKIPVPDSSTKKPS